MRICPKCGFTARGQTLGTHVKKCGVSAVDLFWSMADRSGDACWIWRGFTDKWGYGHHAISTKRVQAHRHAYELTHGPIPAGKLVMHSCDNPPCINPAHLGLGTDQDNMADKVRRGRTTRGEKSWTAKLTEAQVREIRLAYRRIDARRGNGPELALKYGVTSGTITGIAARRIWAHVK